ESKSLEIIIEPEGAADKVFKLKSNDPAIAKVDEKGVITEGSFNGSGCAISQASVDMMLDDIIGKTTEEALRLSDLFTDMIHGKVSDDSALEELDEAASLKNISFMPARVKCAVLGWHTMEEMLKNGKSEGQGQASHCNI
ncbi:MAG: SUF system NifU family Fe-S cluster assembly protein, partial [Treponema sp.]|nr:SUF system NifU family Fe-S cluster assembly protein [Treponema sp.]